MNIVCRNCRGTGSRVLPTCLRRFIVNKILASFIILVETHANMQKENNIVLIIPLWWSLGDNQAGSGVSRSNIHGRWRFWRNPTSLFTWRCVVIIVHLGFSLWFMLTSTHTHLSIPLWWDLKAIVRDLVGEWGLLGDFNSILHVHEKEGGSAYLQTRGMQAFSDILDECCLLDVGQTLDQPAVGSVISGRNMVHHLAPVLKSDHRPLLLQFNQGEQQNRHCIRPFKFLVAWITHENFGEFFRNKWAPSKNLAPMSIEEFQLALKNCNNNVFGNIHRKKKGLLCTLSHDKSPCIKTFGMNMKMSSSRRNYCGSKSQGVSGLSLI